MEQIVLNKVLLASRFKPKYTWKGVSQQIGKDSIEKILDTLLASETRSTGFWNYKE